FRHLYFHLEVAGSGFIRHPGELPQGADDVQGSEVAEKRGPEDPEQQRHDDDDRLGHVRQQSAKAENEQGAGSVGGGRDDQQPQGDFQDDASLHPDSIPFDGPMMVVLLFFYIGRTAADCDPDYRGPRFVPKNPSLSGYFTSDSQIKTKPAWRCLFHEPRRAAARAAGRLPRFFRRGG